MAVQPKRLKIVNNGQFRNKYGTVISETPTTYSVRLDGAGMFNRVSIQREDANLIPFKKSFPFSVYPGEPHRNRNTLNLDIAGFLDCGGPEPFEAVKFTTDTTRNPASGGVPSGRVAGTFIIPRAGTYRFRHSATSVSRFSGFGLSTTELTDAANPIASADLYSSTTERLGPNDLVKEYDVTFKDDREYPLPVHSGVFSGGSDITTEHCLELLGPPALSGVSELGILLLRQDLRASNTPGSFFTNVAQSLNFDSANEDPFNAVKFSRMDQLEQWRWSDGGFRFFSNYITPTPVTASWIQTSNPVTHPTADTVTGFQLLEITGTVDNLSPFGGIGRRGTSSQLAAFNGNPGAATWWWAIAAFGLFGNVGVPVSRNGSIVSNLYEFYIIPEDPSLLVV